MRTAGTSCAAPAGRRAAHVDGRGARSGSANIANLDDKAKDCNILLKTEHDVNIENVMSNSFGFGGTNATLVFSKYHA